MMPLFQTKGTDPVLINPALVKTVLLISTENWLVIYQFGGFTTHSEHGTEDSARSEMAEFAELFESDSLLNLDDIHWDAGMPREIASDPDWLPGSGYLEWPENVRQWAEDRNILADSTPRRQFDGKLMEEIDELRVGIEKWVNGDPDSLTEAEDAIGDINTVLRIIAALMGISWAKCFESSWDNIKDRKGTMIDGVFVKEEA